MSNRQTNYSISFGTKRYSREFQCDPEYQERWQRVLARLYRDHAVGHCGCPGRGERPIYIRPNGDRYHLAKYSDTGPDHARDCCYYAAQDDDEAPEDRAAGDDVAATRSETIRLAIGLHIRTEPPGSGPVAGSTQVRGRRSTPITALSKLLHMLWSRAGLNEWRADWTAKRYLFSINRRLREAAEHVQINSAALVDHLLVGAVTKDEEGKACNVEVVRAAEGKSVRLLVLAKMAHADPSDDLKQLRISNFQGIPWLFVSDRAAERAQREFGRELLAWRQGQGMMFLAQIEPIKGREAWRVVDLALMLVNRDLVGQPAERST